MENSAAKSQDMVSPVFCKDQTEEFNIRMGGDRRNLSKTIIELLALYSTSKDIFVIFRLEDSEN